MEAFTRHASGVWRSTLQDGAGAMTTASGALQEVPFNRESRFGDEQETNPEELISAAQAGCYSMALANYLDSQGYLPKEIRTRATIRFDDGAIAGLHLDIDGKVPDIEQAEFERLAREAEQHSPVANLLRPGLAISLEANLRES